MDIHFHLNGMDFVWNASKAAGNHGKHDGVTFEQAAWVFFLTPSCAWWMPAAMMRRAML